jgi:putative SOS response-associated peptidase YedK
MPVMLHREDYTEWLDPAASAADRTKMLRPFPAEEMEAYPVSTRVNKVQNEDAECIEPRSEAG